MRGLEGSEVPAIRVERASWSQHDFLEEIINDHFVIISQGETGYSWNVDAVTEDVDSNLESLCSKLVPLGWVPILDEDEPYFLEIKPHPIRGAVLGSRSLFFLWCLSFSFLTVIGASWSGRVNASIDPASWNALQIGAIQYALPIMASIGLASVLRRFIARRHGVVVDHLLPVSIPFPITGLSPIWPFGLIGILQTRRIDEIRFPNPHSLAKVSLVLPLTMIVSGIIFVFVGLFHTPSTPNQIDEIPFVLNLNWFVETIGSMIIGNEVQYKVQWASPLLLAGHGMMIVGFILLLPIPNFPGDHVFSAYSGRYFSKDTSFQAWGLLATVVIALFVYFQGDYWLWIAIGSLAVWRRFQSDTIPIPLVVNETECSNDRVFWSHGVILAFLLIACPSFDVTYSLENWEDDLDSSDWMTEYVVTLGNNSSLEYPLSTNGLLDLSGRVHVSPTGAIDGWIIEIMCPDEENFSGLDCVYSDVSQQSSKTIKIRLEPPSESITGVIQLDLLFHSTNGIEINHRTSVSVVESVRILDEGWISNMNQNHCVRMAIGFESLPANITLDDPMWSLIQGNVHAVYDPINITEENPELVCVEPLEGAIQMASKSEDGRILGPTISYQSDDGSSLSLTAPLVDVNRSLVTLENYTEFDSVSPFNANAIGWHLNQSSACSESPDTLLSGNWSWSPSTSNNDSQIVHFSDDLQNGKLLLPDFGILTVCNDSSRTIFELSSGPSLLVNGELMILNSDVSDSSIIISNVGMESVSLIPVIHSSIPLDSVWNVTIPDYIAVNGSITIDTNRPDVFGGFTSIWFESSTVGLEIHFAALCYPETECGLG